MANPEAAQESGLNKNIVKSRNEYVLVAGREHNHTEEERCTVLNK